MTLLVAQSMDEKINLTINGTPFHSFPSTFIYRFLNVPISTVGKESIFLTIKAHPAQGVYGVNPVGLDFCDDHGIILRSNKD